MFCSSKSNSSKSPLLRLPAELRNQIFGYIFEGTKYTVNTKIWDHDNACPLDDSPVYMAPGTSRIQLQPSIHSTISTYFSFVARFMQKQRYCRIYMVCSTSGIATSATVDTCSRLRSSWVRGHRSKLNRWLTSRWKNGHNS